MRGLVQPGEWLGADVGSCFRLWQMGSPDSASVEMSSMPGLPVLLSPGGHNNLLLLAESSCIAFRAEMRGLLADAEPTHLQSVVSKFKGMSFTSCRN